VPITTGSSHDDSRTFVLSCRIILKIKNFSDRKNKNFSNRSLEIMKTHFFMFSNLSENYDVHEITWKIWYSRRGHRWQYRTVQALCVLDNYGYKHTRIICNTSCFSTAALVTRTRLSVAWYVHCLSCWSLIWMSRYCRIYLELFFWFPQQNQNCGRVNFWGGTDAVIPLNGI
jgi:hypothetical protein